MIIPRRNWRQIEKQHVIFKQCHIVTELKHVRLRDQFAYEATKIPNKSSTQSQSFQTKTNERLQTQERDHPSRETISPGDRVVPF